MHELLHFVECTLDFGPVNNTSLFTYEQLNRIIVRSVKGKNLIGEEFIKLFSTAQCLSKLEPSSEKMKEYLQNNSILKTSNRKKKAQSESENILKFLSVKTISTERNT